MTTRQVTTVVHPAMTRGHVDHGWLDSHHTFSFGTYYHPERTHFGALRVLNDDVVQGGSGFGPHAHENMEIIRFLCKVRSHTRIMRGMPTCFDVMMYR